jgi:hypothetical protein
VTTVSVSDESSSLAGVMRPFLKVPRTVGLGGAALLLVIAGLLVSLRGLRKKGEVVPPTARSSHTAEVAEAAQTALAAPPAEPPAEKPVESPRAATSATAASPELPRMATAKSKPRPVSRVTRAPNAAPPPPASATISLPPAPVATIDPESIYTDRK